MSVTNTWKSWSTSRRSQRSRAISHAKMIKVTVKLPHILAALATPLSIADRLRRAHEHPAPEPANTCDHQTAARRARCCGAATRLTAWPRYCRPCRRDAQEKVFERIGVEAGGNLVRDLGKASDPIVIVEPQLAKPPFTQPAKVAEHRILRLGL